MILTIRPKQSPNLDCSPSVDRSPRFWGSRVYAETTDRRGPMMQPSLFTVRAPVALPCPGACSALRYAEGHALAAARRTRTSGLRAETGCSQCGGIALARVVALAPVELESAGGIPRRPPWMGWTEYAVWRAVLLQRRTLRADWRRRLVFRHGWRAGGRMR